MNPAADEPPRTLQLEGEFISAVPVPFDANGRFVASAQEAYCTHLASRPISGVALWAHTGRGLHIDESVAREVLRSWRDALDDRLIVAGAGAPLVEAETLPDSAAGDQAYVDLAVRMADRAAKEGADAILCFAPYRFLEHPNRRRWILAYHEALARSGLPLIAFYLYEAAGGVSYEPEELRDILSLDSVAAIKMATLDSVCTFQEVARMLAAEFPRKTLISGEDRFLGYSLMCGARSCLVGMGAACPGFQKRMVDAALANDRQRFVELLLAVDDFAQRTFIPPMEGYIRRMMWVLVTQGVLPESAAHDPWFPEISSEEKRGIETLLAQMNELGLTD